jgi:hypothetical protein
MGSGRRNVERPDDWTQVVGMPDETCQVPLTKGMVAIIDKEDYERVASISWHYEHGYARADSKHGKIYMHRFINNTPKGLFTDHRNGDRLDNRKTNLRNATRAQNTYNASGVKSSTSGLKGVSRHKQTGKWRARIMVDYKEIHLGIFDTKETAYQKYVEAAKLYQGEFARVA